MNYEPGKEYLVPTIGNVAVILPAHVDQGNGEATGRHYHVDHRFGPGVFDIDDIDESFAAENGLAHNTTSMIVEDDGRPLVWKKCKAVHLWTPSGEVFTSTCWLYFKFGDQPAKDGHCVHHHTELQPTRNCLICPAHGMKFNLDGSPAYKAPFWLCMDDVRVLLTDKTHTLTGLSGALLEKTLRLEDDEGEVIASDSPHNLSMGDYWLNRNDNLKLTLNSWSDNPCLRLKTSTL